MSEMPINTKELIDYKFNEVFKRLDRMESTMNDFAFVKQSEFDSFHADYDNFKREVREGYVRRESFKWVQNVVGGIAIGVGVAIVIGTIKFIGSTL